MFKFKSKDLFRLYYYIKLIHSIYELKLNNYPYNIHILSIQIVTN